MYDTEDTFSLKSQINAAVTERIVLPGGERHYIVKDSGIRMMLDKFVTGSVAQAVWLVQKEELVPEGELFTACGMMDCVLHLEHKPTVSDPVATVGEDGGEDEEEVLALVQRHTTAVTLADLYRRGRAKGLLAGGSNYH
jgi:hypothetical protein